MPTPDSKPPGITRMIRQLRNSDEARRQRVPPRELDPQMAMLRAWQSERLTHTYADLLEQPQFGPACRFVLSDIYAPRDFSQRDHDAEQIHSVLSRFLPAEMLKLLTDAIEMNGLNAALDQALLRVLVDQLGMGEVITPEMYAEAYRRCDNYAERRRQIDLVADILSEVGEGARATAVGIALGLVRKPAEQLGWGELHDMLVRGREALKPMRDVKAFVNTICERETRILDRIYAKAPDPFEWSGEQ